MRRLRTLLRHVSASRLLLALLRHVSASRLFLTLLLFRQIRLLLGALLRRRLLLQRPLCTLFPLGLPRRLLALLSGRLCPLLRLRSAPLPLGAGLAFKLASLSAFVGSVFLRPRLCKAGSDGPGEQNQSGCVHHSYQFHGRCLRARDTKTQGTNETKPDELADSAGKASACHRRWETPAGTGSSEPEEERVA